MRNHNVKKKSVFVPVVNSTSLPDVKQLSTRIPFKINEKNVNLSLIPRSERSVYCLVNGQKTVAEIASILHHSNIDQAIAYLNSKELISFV